MTKEMSESKGRRVVLDGKEKDAVAHDKTSSKPQTATASAAGTKSASKHAATKATATETQNEIDDGIAPHRINASVCFLPN